MSIKSNYLMAMEEWANIYFGRSLSDYFIFLKSSVISMQQAYVLTYLHYNAPSKISEICEHMMVSAPAVSQMVDRLENQNLVTRIPDPGDRRVRNVVLSDQGERFVLQSIEARRSWVKEVPAQFSEEQLDQISSALQLLISVYRGEEADESFNFPATTHRRKFENSPT
jgi:DNA-binding MarR family transcriptional regulator